MSNRKLPDLEQFMKEVHRVAAERGWWEKPHKTPLECMALMVSEVAEAMEEVRSANPRPPIYQIQDWGDGGPVDIVTPQEHAWVSSEKPEGQAVELADVILRIFDYCEYHKLPLIEALLLKHEFNKSRPWKHGKKL